MKIDLHLRHLSSTPNLCSSEMLCNLLLWSCFSSLLMFGLGCEEEIPLPMQIADAAMPQKMEPDAAPMPVVPQSAPEIFQNLPNPPTQIKRKPGEPVGNLKSQVPNLQAPYSPRFLVESRTEGPFRTIVYQLDAKKRTIEAVTATFQPNYMHSRQYRRLETYMKLRLGEGTKFFEKNHKGRRWATLDYRIELFVDVAVKDAVLLFHKRGAETLERTMKGLK